MSHLLVKAIRVRVRNSPKVSLCATPDQFFCCPRTVIFGLAFSSAQRLIRHLLPLALPFPVVSGHHSGCAMPVSFSIAYLGYLKPLYHNKNDRNNCQSFMEEE